MLRYSEVSHMASLVANAIAMYSDSAEDAAAAFILKEDQLTGACQDMKIKPPLLYRVSLSPAQSESVYPFITAYG